MLDNPEIVKHHIKEIREIFDSVKRYSKEELQKLCWDNGVIGRSFYVVGAYMCKIINEKSGVDSIKSTLLEGPVSFFNLYNKLAQRDMRLFF